MTQEAVTGEILLEAQFDTKVSPYFRWVGVFWLVISVAGILLIPFWLLMSGWYGYEFHRRMSGRLTAQASEIRKGVFFRSESTIPLNRITDLRLHDDPLMRHYGTTQLEGGNRGPGKDHREAKATWWESSTQWSFATQSCSRGRRCWRRKPPRSPASSAAARWSRQPPDRDTRHPRPHGSKAVGIRIQRALLDSRLSRQLTLARPGSLTYCETHYSFQLSKQAYIGPTLDSIQVAEKVASPPGNDVETISR